MNARTLILFFLMGSVASHAQETAEDPWSAWYMYFGTNRVSERFSIHTEAQLRYYETTENFNQSILRTALNYHINPNAMASIGYGFIDTDPSFGELPGEVNVKENRIYGQLVLRDQLWEFQIRHRYRLEHRILDLGDVTDTRHRARYQLQLTLPLTDTFFLNFSDELMINLQDDLFDQNRLYAALGVNITWNSSIQVGYMRNQFSNTVHDRLQIGVYYNPDLRSLFVKKKS